MAGPGAGGKIEEARSRGVEIWDEEQFQAATETAAARVLLNCPFADKDAAKALGARWDAGLKKWYIEAGTPLAPFAAWLP